MFAEPATAPPPPPKENVTSTTYTIHSFVEEEASFPGGTSALSKFLGENIKFPQRAFDEKISGKLYLQFVVDHEGNVGSIKIKKPIEGCPECSEEAIRVVKMMPKWKPALINQKAVSAYYNLPISFVFVAEESESK